MLWGMTNPTAAPTPTDPARPVLTIREAAEACQVDRKTIVRRLDVLARLGANKDDAGVWRIPIEALLHPDADLPTPGTMRRPAATPPAAAAAQPAAPAADQGEAARLRQALAEATARAELAEALLAERDRTVRIAELALRQLPPAPQPAPQPGTSGGGRRGGLWGWLLGPQHPPAAAPDER